MFVVYLYVELMSIKLERFARRRILIAYLVLGIFTLMNLLYFANIIPPIPLSLRDAGVYHNVERVGGSYNVLAEDESWLQKLLPGQTVHVHNGDRLFVYTSIFAPAELNTTIVHRWEYFDAVEREWIDRGSFSYGIAGGRQDGYRGYSLKSSLREGKWRVYVETERGQVLGRVKFNVDIVDDELELMEFVK